MCCCFPTLFEHRRLYIFCEIDHPFKKIEVSWFTMLCQFLVYSKSGFSYIYIYTVFHMFFSIMACHRIVNGSLCYIVASCCLSILCMMFYICLSQTSNPTLLHPYSSGKHKSVLYVDKPSHSWSTFRRWHVFFKTSFQNVDLQ